jgi:hypothetical protein
MGEEGGGTRSVLPLAATKSGMYYDPQAYTYGHDPAYARNVEQDYRTFGANAEGTLGGTAMTQQGAAFTGAANIANASDAAAAQGAALGAGVSAEGARRANVLSALAGQQGQGITDYAQGAAGDISSAATQRGNAISQLAAKLGAGVTGQARSDQQMLMDQAATNRELALQQGAFQSGAMRQMGQQDRTLLTGQGQAALSSGNLANQRAMRSAQGLQRIEANEGPSAAQAQLQQGLDQSMAANLAMAKSGRGFGGGASAMSEAARQNAIATQQAAGQSAQLRAQENAEWRQRQAANIGTAAGVMQGIGAQQTGLGAQQSQAGVQAGQAATQAGFEMGQQAAQFGLQQGQQGMQNAVNVGQQGMLAGSQMRMAGTETGAQVAGQGEVAGAQIGLEGTQAGAGMRVGGYQDASNLAVGAQGTGAEIAQTGAQQQIAGTGQAVDALNTGLASTAATQQAGINANMAAKQAAQNTQTLQSQMLMQQQDAVLRRWAAEQGVSLQAAQQQLQLLGAGIGAAGTMGAALLSDERAKEEVEPAKGKAAEALSALEPVSFRYKPGFGKDADKRFGLIAQHLERTEAGRSAVADVGGVKMVKVPELAAMTATAYGELSEQVNELKRSFAALRARRRD